MWSLYIQVVFISRLKRLKKLYPWGPVKRGPYKQVVFIYRWYLDQVSLYLNLKDHWIYMYPLCWQINIFSKSLTQLIESHTTWASASKSEISLLENPPPPSVLSILSDEAGSLACDGQQFPTAWEAVCGRLSRKSAMCSSRYTVSEPALTDALYHSREYQTRWWTISLVTIWRLMQCELTFLRVHLYVKAYFSQSLFDVTRQWLNNGNRRVAFRYTGTYKHGKRTCTLSIHRAEVSES